jgi:4-hydroxy-3-methylbut-2-en-1-yl diphosphate reductase
VHVFQDKKDLPELSLDEEFAVLSQTTLNYIYVQDLLQVIKEKYPKAHIPVLSDVCKATSERQEVILQNIDAFDTFIVIGGKESNNTRELYEIGLRHKKLSFCGESLDDILSFGEEKLLSQERVAITGGASTPAEDIKAVFDFFKEHGYAPKVLSLVAL